MHFLGVWETSILEWLGFVGRKLENLRIFIFGPNSCETIFRMKHHAIHLVKQILKKFETILLKKQILGIYTQNLQQSNNALQLLKS